MAVIKRPDRGYWEADFRYTDPDTGREKRFRKKAPVQNRRAAAEWEREMFVKLTRETPRHKTKEVPLFDEFVDEFLRTYVATNNKPSEKVRKEIVINKHLLPRFKGRRIDRITTRDVEQMKAEIVEGRKPKTVNNILAVLQKCLSYAEEVGAIDHVPRIKLLKVPPQPFSFLDFDEYQKIVTTLGKRDERLLVAFLLGTDAGLRRGEIAGLKWSDINLMANKLTVYRQYWMGQELSPKNGRHRTIPLSQKLHTALRSYRHLRSQFVICNDDGEPWRDKMFRIHGERIYSLSEVRRPSQPWHCLRHTFCSHLAMRGATPKAIQELAGHQTIDMTMRYMHLSPAARESAIKLLDKPWVQFGYNEASAPFSDERIAVISGT